MNDNWKSVVGFEGIYDVSDSGEIMRIGRAARTGNGHGGGVVLGRVKKPQTINGGYLVVMLWKNGNYFPKLVHILVAHAFLGPVHPGKEINHIDGVKSNNAASNLEYVTHSENNFHSYALGLHPSGERHLWSKLTAAKVVEIRTTHAGGKLGYGKLAKKFLVSKTCVASIIKGRSWKYV